METTNQQKEILESVKKYKTIKINAFAGTGKTSTLQLIANSYKDKRILYLAFNTSIKNEASTKFESNVFVKTTHGLAYSAVKKYTNIDLSKVTNYRAIDISKKYNITYNQAIGALKIFESFCNNTKDEISKDDVEHKTAHEMFSSMLINKLDPTHGFYLKYYYLLLKSQQISQYSYDIVMLDEAQDTNEVTLGIFEHLNGKTKIYVGDDHQQIYSFRGSKNALDKLQCNKKLNLSISFRFNEIIANYANILLKNFKDEEVQIESFKDIYEPIETNAFISRTNATLISTIAQRINSRQPFVTLRDPSEIFSLTNEVLHFLNDDKKLIKRNRFLKDFYDIDELNEYAKEVEDFELKSAIKVANEYKEDIFEFEKIATQFYKAWSNRENNGFNKRVHEILFLTTAHTSKGLQWDCVTVSDDFADFAEIVIDMGFDSFSDFKTNKSKAVNKELNDEFNLFYVALTRAQKRLIKDSVNFHYLMANDIEKLIDSRIKDIKQDLNQFSSGKKTKPTRVTKLHTDDKTALKEQRNIQEGKAKKSGMRWSLEDKVKVKSLYKQNKTIKHIASKLDRTSGAILGELLKSELITKQQQLELSKLTKEDETKAYRGYIEANS